MAQNKTTRDGICMEYQVPFCRPIKCSISVKTDTDGREVWSVNGREAPNVLWSCLPSDCQGYITGLLAVLVMLAVMTITFNCLILGINLASKTRRMRKRNPTINNYSNYVVSLAVADLLLGVIVLPLCVANFYFEFLSNPIDFLKSSAHQADNAQPNVTWTPGTATVQAQTPLTEGADSTSLPRCQTISSTADENYQVPLLVRDMLGLFTHLTLFVSVYTLISASADRFYAASHSVRLRTPKTSKTPEDKKIRWIKKAIPSARRSTVIVFIVWGLGLIFAIMPLITRHYFYFRHIGHVFAAMTSDVSHGAGVKWYLFTLVLPLAGMWGLNLMICFTLWRRKSQLGLRRRQSLHRKLLPGSSSTSGTKASALKVTSTLSDSVFEPADEGKTPAVQKYPASRWNQPDAKFEAQEDKNGVKTPFSRPKGFRMSGGSASPPSNQSSLRGSRSGVKRKVSSIRRAKELLKNQSYEANITKTLCIVVIAFTVAVLPLIVALGSIARETDRTPAVLNREVTALTCSLLLLFSNSFVNCVIYGARMRDFRTAVGQLCRAFFYRVKNTLCCSCLRGNEQSFGSESVTSVLHFSRHSRNAAHQASPHLAAELRSRFWRKRASAETNSDSKQCHSIEEPADDKCNGSRKGSANTEPMPLIAEANGQRLRIEDAGTVALPEPCLFRGRSAIYTRRQHSEQSAAPNSVSRFSWRSGSLVDDAHCSEAVSPAKAVEFRNSSDSSRSVGKASEELELTELDCNDNGIANYAIKSFDNEGNTDEHSLERSNADEASAPNGSSKISAEDPMLQSSDSTERFFDADDLIGAMDAQLSFTLDLEAAKET